MLSGKLSCILELNCSLTYIQGSLCNSVLIHTWKGEWGGGELTQREGEWGSRSQSWVENTNMTDCTHCLLWILSFYGCNVQNRPHSLLTKSKVYSESPIKFLFWLSLSLNFLHCTFMAWFRNRRLSESRNKLLEKGNWKDFTISKWSHT
jgi:hypothetical protein